VDDRGYDKIVVANTTSTQIKYRKVWSCFIGLIVVVAVSIGFRSFLEATLMRAQGHVVRVREPLKEVAVQPGAESTSVTFEIENLCSHDVKIVGVDATCGCFSATKLPATIPKNGLLLFEMRLSVPGTGLAPFEYTQSARLFVDTPSPPIVLIVAAKVEGL
jgi:hypothetical protein